MDDNQIKESLLGVPHVREAVITFAHVNGKTIDEVLDLIVSRIRVTNLQKTTRRLVNKVWNDPVMAYVVAAKEGIVKDPVIK